jgi:hypothetical protein
VSLIFAAHKVASTIAVRCPFVLKLASKTPLLGALLLGESLTADEVIRWATNDYTEVRVMVMKNAEKLQSNTLPVDWEEPTASTSSNKYKCSRLPFVSFSGPKYPLYQLETYGLPS